MKTKPEGEEKDILKEVLVEIIQTLWNGGMISKDNGEYLLQEIEKL